MKIQFYVENVVKYDFAGLGEVHFSRGTVFFTKKL